MGCSLDCGVIMTRVVQTMSLVIGEGAYRVLCAARFPATEILPVVGGSVSFGDVRNEVYCEVTGTVRVRNAVVV